MSDITLDPYIYFKGNAREAMEFYKGAFGGELFMQTYGEVPDAGMPVTEDNKDRLMHARLEGGAAKIMASDTDGASASAAKIDLSLGGTDEVRLREIFTKLSEGGQVHQELQKMFWGDTFGALTDKYGVNWMFNITAKSEA